MVLFILFIFAAHIIGDITGQPNKNETGLSTKDIFGFVIIGIMLAGLVAAWKWEMLGGIIAVVAYLSFLILVPNALSALPFLICGICGLFFIWSAIMHRGMQKDKTDVKIPAESD
jgi:hypothetical protein